MGFTLSGREEGDTTSNGRDRSRGKKKEEGETAWPFVGKCVDTGADAKTCPDHDAGMCVYCSCAQVGRRGSGRGRKPSQSFLRVQGRGLRGVSGGRERFGAAFLTLSFSWLSRRFSVGFICGRTGLVGRGRKMKGDRAFSFW